MKGENVAIKFLCGERSEPHNARRSPVRGALLDKTICFMGAFAPASSIIRVTGAFFARSAKIAP